MRWWQTCFMIFGIACFIILIILIVAGSYMWIKDPFGIKPFITQEGSVSQGAATNTPRHPLLTSEQEALLKNYGIDVNKLPTEITPELKACAEVQLGKQRFEELKKGAEPTPGDFLKAKNCIK